MEMKKVWFDMDGTIADLYAVEGWLTYLENDDTFPYDNAQVMLNFSLFARLLNALQRKGWEIGIVSWTSKCGSDLYNGQIAYAKICWLFKHLPSVKWDSVQIVPYGTNKYDLCGGGILFDDEERNRNEWEDISYTPENIIPILKELLAV